MQSATNQPPDLVDYNLFTSHPVLVDALAREGAAGASEQLAAVGARLGSAEMFALADAANRNPPVLKSFDRFGNRRDDVEFHPAWHELLRRLVSEGLHTGPWAQPAPGAHVARAVAYMLWAEVENGTQCPATMTYGAVPVLARQAGDFAEWLPRLLSREYDERRLPIRAKRGALIGMGMTEKQGGSDVRTNITRATAVGAAQPGREYRLDGRAWVVVLLHASAIAGRIAEFVPIAATEGQAGQSLERFERSGVS
jgi:putative acyl-CoA dehydrogenase